MTEPANAFTLLDIRRAVESGVLTIQQSIEAADKAARQTRPWLHAFSYLPDAPVVNQADIGLPLAGVPIGIKDLIDTADMPTEYNSPAYAGRTPDTDAILVARLRQAGGTIVGKTVTTEFAWRHPGPTVNPWNEKHTPGGSSSGSAAAVSAGIVPLAFGTQTFGSVIRPAAYCGVVGFKPTYGSIARTGVLPLAPSLDHIGMFTANVADAAYAFKVVAGSDDQDFHYSHVCSKNKSQGNDGSAVIRIGMLRRQVGTAMEPAQDNALARLAAQLKADGADVVTVDLPTELEDMGALVSAILAVEAALVHGALLDRSPGLISSVMTSLINEGRGVSAVDYARARAAQVRLAHFFDNWLLEDMRLDALLVAPATGEAPVGLGYTGDASMCAPWTFLGVPAISLPIALGPAGLPLGAQLIGAAQHDERLLAVAEWVEARAGWQAVKLQAKGGPDSA
jgi:Asp-tRNA(Asn)/Glu-tRNA(Gln) amidotransferase A subunit family amidase